MRLMMLRPPNMLNMVASFLCPRHGLGQSRLWWAEALDALTKSPWVQQHLTVDGRPPVVVVVVVAEAPMLVVSRRGVRVVAERAAAVADWESNVAAVASAMAA